VQAGIAARDRVADAIALPGVVEQHLIGLGNGIVTAELAHIDATIGEHQMGFRGAFLVGLVATGARAHDVRHSYGRRAEQSLNREVFHPISAPVLTPASSSTPRSRAWPPRPPPGTGP